jgi:beta-glucuronidase
MKESFTDVHFLLQFLYRTLSMSIVILSSFPIALNAQTASLDPTLSLVQTGGVTVPYQNGIPLPSFEKQLRPTISLAGAWRKSRFNANHNVTLYNRAVNGYALILSESANRQTVNYDDSQWEYKSLPAIENNLLGYEKTPEYYESGVWCRRSFTVPDSLKQFSATLMFYAVNYVCDVWLNGTYLGFHEGGYTPFAFDVSSLLRTDTTNVLSVRVDNIPWGTRKDIVPYYTCDWFNYTGIIHDVYLEFTNPISVVRADIVPQNINGGVQTTVILRNLQLQSGNVDVKLQVYHAKTDTVSLMKEVPAELIGTEAAVTGTTTTSLVVTPDSVSVWRTTLAISNPQLWSPRKPNLYILKVTVTKNGTVLDEFATQFGIRTVRTMGNKFLLNEKPAFLHGTARHEDHPSYGRSVPKSVIFSDFLAIKKMNVNFVRTAHYPNHPYTYLLADRLGLLIMEEIPVWWFDDATSWSLQNDTRHIHQQMFREMVFRDYNRPAIALWSTCNECLDVDGRKTFIRTVRQELDTLYPDGRLVTQSAAADRPGANDASQGECDVPSWTMYFGIFHGGTMFDGTKQFVTAAANAFPNKPIMDTEFGYWSSENGASQQRQLMTFDSTFMAFAPFAPVDNTGKPNPAGPLMGVTWWCAFDWYTHQQTAGFQSMGLIKMDRSTTKPVMSHLVDAYKNYVDNSEYITQIESAPASNAPSTYTLFQNYPNPFNPRTMIRYQLPSQGMVSLKVYDLLGREVATLVNEFQDAGVHQSEFGIENAKGGSGIYFYRLQSAGYSETKKMVGLQ